MGTPDGATSPGAVASDITLAGATARMSKFDRTVVPSIATWKTLPPIGTAVPCSAK